MLSCVMAMLLLLFCQISLQVIADRIQPETVIPLSCWNNAKQRFSIGNKGVWGPKLWHSLHCTALNYPNDPSEADKQNYKSFYLNVHRIIPCRLCAQHYQANVINYDLEKYMHSPTDLFAFTVDIHNLVNQQLNKPSFTLQDALKMYQSSCSQCTNTSHNLEDLIDGLTPKKAADTASKSQDQMSLLRMIICGGAISIVVLGVFFLMFVVIRAAFSLKTGTRIHSD